VSGVTSTEAVLLDVGGTLDADGLPWSTQFHDAYRAHGGRLDAPAFAALFRVSDERLARLPGVDVLGFRATLEAQGAVLAELLPDAAAVDIDAVVSQVHRVAAAMAARNRTVLDALAPHVRLGVVSNFTGNLAPCLAELGLLRYFDVVLDSTAVGVAKPDPRIFRLALDALGAPAERTLMVGDNPFADVRGAAACGLRTCWLAPTSRPTPDDVRPDARVARLTELPALLGVGAAGREAACTG
jgi:putative hydrolase of the HAD superfamily